MENAAMAYHLEWREFQHELAETRIRLTTDRGTPESFGGSDIPYTRFERSEKWQKHVSEVFGEHVLAAVLAAVSSHTRND